MISQRILRDLLVYMIILAAADPTEGGRFMIVSVSLESTRCGLSLNLLRVYTGQDRKGA